MSVSIEAGETLKCLIQKVKTQQWMEKDINPDNPSKSNTVVLLDGYAAGVLWVQMHCCVL